jgi:hypothetical protein
LVLTINAPLLLGAEKFPTAPQLKGVAQEMESTPELFAFSFCNP